MNDQAKEGSGRDSTQWAGCSQSEWKTKARELGSQQKDSMPLTELSAKGPFESDDLLQKGFSCAKNELLPSHPLELSEKNSSSTKIK